MGKKKGQGGGGNGFDKNLSVIEAAKQVVKPYVEGLIQDLGMQLKRENVESMRMLYTRITTLEGLCLEKFEMTEDQLADLVADTEDKSSGFERVNGVVEEGDLVRLEIATKIKDKKEFAGSSKLIIENTGKEPFMLGAELEPKLIGLESGSTTEFEFGKDKAFLAKIIINRVSRRPKVVEAPKTIEAGSEPKEEAENESTNAGA